MVRMMPERRMSSARAYAYGLGAPDEDCARADAKRLHDITASSNPRIEKDLGLAIGCREHFRQYAQRRCDAVELPATVI